MSTATEAVTATSIWSHGSLIDLRVSMWSGQRAVKPSDLGLNVDELPEVLTRIVLLPDRFRKRFNTLRVRAMQAIDLASLPFGVTTARFVPYRRLAVLHKRLSELRADFFESVESLMDEYEALRDDAIRQYQSVLPVIESAFPTPHDVRSRFRFEWVLYEFRIPKGVRVALENAEHAITEAQLRERAEDTARREAESVVRRFAELAASEMREKLLAGVQHVRDRIRAGAAIDGKQLRGLRLTLDRVNELNILDDQAVGASIASIREQLNGTSAVPAGISESDVNAFRSTLDDAIARLSDWGAVMQTVEDAGRRIDLNESDVLSVAAEACGPRRVAI